MASSHIVSVGLPEVTDCVVVFFVFVFFLLFFSVQTADSMAAMRIETSQKRLQIISDKGMAANA